MAVWFACVCATVGTAVPRAGRERRVMAAWPGHARAAADTLDSAGPRVQ